MIKFGKNLSYLTLIVTFLATSTDMYATKWQIEDGLIPKTATERLIKRKPEVKNALDLEDLLRDIGRRFPLLILEAHHKNGIWFLSGKKSKLITNIETEMTTRIFKSQLNNLTQPYIGQGDSNEIRQKIKKLIANYLKNRGYPVSHIEIETELDDNGMAYYYGVDEGDACLIKSVTIAFPLPDSVELDVSSGDICDVEQISNDVATLEDDLKDLGYNQHRIELLPLRYDRKNNLATVYIAGSLGQRVRYQVIDLSKRFLIDDLFADEELTNVDPTIVSPDAMRVELARRYKNRGFSDVKVNGPDIQKDEDGIFDYVYTVTPGTQYVLKDVQFEGVTAFTEKELKEIMGLSSLWQISKPLNLDELKEGLDRLRALYQEKGYWNVKVRDPGGGAKDSKTGSVQIRILVDEGLPHIFRKIVFKGNTIFDHNFLSKLLKIAPNQPLNRSKLVDFQRSLRTTYVEKGYLYADTLVDLKTFSKRHSMQVDITVGIEENVRVKIGDISIIGLVKTNPKVVKHELLFQTGDWYNPKKISKSRLGLTRRGLFRSVQIMPFDQNAIIEKQEVLDILIDVREGKAGNISFGPGWSFYRGWRYGTEASYNNISGIGRQASLRGSFSEERHQEAVGSKTLVGRKFGAGYLEPYIFDWPVDGTVGMSQQAQAISNYWQLRYSGETALKHKLKWLLPGSLVSVFYRQEIAREEGTLETADELIAGDVRVGTSGIRAVVDERDNMKFPTSGYTINTEVAWARYALGGDMRFFKWDISNSHYFSLMSKLVLVLGFQFTSYEGIEREAEADDYDILPPSERLFAGGANTVRGYKEGTLGPVVHTPVFDGDGDERGWTGDYKFSELGGSRRTVLKSELRYKVTNGLATSVFIDSGNTFFQNEEIDKFDRAYSDPVDPGNCQIDPCPSPYRSVKDNFPYEFTDLIQNPSYIWTKHYQSYGTSLSFLTALGSINLAYGLPWHEPVSDDCKNDKNLCFTRKKQSGHWLTRGQFHINIGTQF